MSGPCTTCRHYRAPVPVSTSLVQRIGLPGDQSTLDMWQRVHKAEEQKQGLEARYLAGESDDNAGSERPNQWPFRPRMTPYCGRRESEGIYEIASKKNAGLRCTDHLPGEAPRRPCDSCVHRRVAAGNSTDALLAEQALRVRHDGPKPRMGDERAVGQIYANAAARLSGEMAMAFFGEGSLPRQPRYLDWCGRFSRPRQAQFRICSVINSGADCAGWERFSYGH
jgi:hypothetical protein